MFKISQGHFSPALSLIKNKQKIGDQTMVLVDVEQKIVSSFINFIENQCLKLSDEAIPQPAYS